MSTLGDFLTVSRARIQVGTPPSALLGVILGAVSLGVLAEKIVWAYFAFVVLVISFASTINCKYDFDVDKLYKKHLSAAVRRLGGGLDWILVAEVLLIFAAIYYFFSSGFKITGMLALFGLFFALAYSVPPVRIKSRGFWSAFPDMIALFGMPLLGGWFLFRQSLTLDFTLFVICYALMNQGIILTNTCEDYGEDKKFGIRTWAHMLGMKRALKAGAALTLFGLVCVAILFSASLVVLPFLLLSSLAIVKTSQIIYTANNAKRLGRKLPVLFSLARYPLLIAAILSRLAI